MDREGKQSARNEMKKKGKAKRKKYRKRVGGWNEQWREKTGHVAWRKKCNKILLEEGWGGFFLQYYFIFFFSDLLILFIIIFFLVGWSVTNVWGLGVSWTTSQVVLKATAYDLSYLALLPYECFFHSKLLKPILCATCRKFYTTR